MKKNITPKSCGHNCVPLKHFQGYTIILESLDTIVYPHTNQYPTLYIYIFIFEQKYIPVKIQVWVEIQIDVWIDRQIGRKMDQNNQIDQIRQVAQIR